MLRTFLAGLTLIAAVGLALLLDGLLDLGLGSVLLGIAIGGALGLARDGTAIGRVGAFAVGFAVALAGYLVRVLVLNDSGVGLFLFAAMVIAVVTVVCALTGDRLPLWAGLLGSATVVGSYEAGFLDAPQNITADLLPATSSVLFCTALGFLAAVAFSLRPREQDDREPDAEQYPPEFETHAAEVAR